MTPREMLIVLQMLVDLEVWKANESMVEGIFLAYLEAIISDPKMKQIRFGSTAYWKEVGELFIPLPDDNVKCRDQSNNLD